jgi:hypothetical protein
MDTNQILTITVFVVVITIVGTIALAAVGYLAFRLRERRNPTRPGIDETMTRPFFFERVRIPVGAATPAATAPGPVRGPALGSGTATD